MIMYHLHIENLCLVTNNDQVFIIYLWQFPTIQVGYVEDYNAMSLWNNNNNKLKAGIDSSTRKCDVWESISGQVVLWGRPTSPFAGVSVYLGRLGRSGTGQGKICVLRCAVYIDRGPFLDWSCLGCLYGRVSEIWSGPCLSLGTSGYLVGTWVGC